MSYLIKMFSIEVGAKHADCYNKFSFPNAGVGSSKATDFQFRANSDVVQKSSTENIFFDGNNACV